MQIVSFAMRFPRIIYMTGFELYVKLERVLLILISSSSFLQFICILLWARISNSVIIVLYFSEWALLLSFWMWITLFCSARSLTCDMSLAAFSHSVRSRLLSHSFQLFARSIHFIHIRQRSIPCYCYYNNFWQIIAVIFSRFWILNFNFKYL